MTGPPEDRAHRVHQRTTIVRLPGILAVLLAIPALFVVGAVAVATLALGVATLLLAPSIVRRRAGGGTGGGTDETITLDRSAYRTTVDRDSGNAARRIAPPSDGGAASRRTP